MSLPQRKTARFQSENLINYCHPVFPDDNELIEMSDNFLAELFFGLIH